MKPHIVLPTNDQEAELLRKMLMSKLDISESAASELTTKLVKVNSDAKKKASIGAYNRRVGDRSLEQLEECVVGKHIEALVYGGKARFTSCVAKVMKSVKKSDVAEQTRLKKAAKSIASVIRNKRMTLKKCENTRKLLDKFPFLDVDMLEYLALEDKYDGSIRDSTVLATFLNKVLRSMKKS